MLEPWLDLFKYEFDAVPFYLGYSNGLTYKTPFNFLDKKVPATNLDAPVSESCYAPLTLIEISDPVPFGGYDCRCRPWY